MAVHESQHPLVKHKVSLLRAHNISVKSFRELTNEIATLLTVEATSKLPLINKPTSCWSGNISAPFLATPQPTLVPILRAGFGMLEGALSILPNAKISVVGLKRNDESTKVLPDGTVSIAIDSYYQNIVTDIAHRQAIIIDPMLATAGSAIACIELLKQSGCNNIIALFIIASPEGVKKLQHTHPDVEVFVANIDEHLDQNGYIIPGLGDAGDKYFGTLD